MGNTKKESNYGDCPAEIKVAIWKFAALQTRDEPRIFPFILKSQSNEFTDMLQPNGEMIRTAVCSPVLAACEELSKE